MMQNTSYSGDSRPNKGFTPDRSTRVVNLNRLSKKLDVDLLAAALLLREELVRALVQGRESMRSEYAQHIETHLQDAGFVPNWLDTPDAPITKENLAELRSLAAMSVQKSPIRRDNFKRLMEAFNHQTPLLCDALEITDIGLKSIIDGTSPFDDHRMGHINPRLMQAGFPNNWLEVPSAPIEPEWLEGLQNLATDSIERELEEQAQQAATPAPTVGAVRIGPPAAVHTIPPHSTPIQTEASHSSTEVTVSKPKKTAITPTNSPQAPAQPPVAATQSTRALPPGLRRAAMSVGRALPPQKVAVAAPAAAKKAGAPASSTPSLKGIASNKEVSLGRAGALAKLLDSARRGVKSCLWETLLGRSLPYWANVRSGSILFRDEMAKDIASVLGIDPAWFDHPEEPPANLVSWVMDSTVPLPKDKAEALALVAGGDHKAAPEAVAEQAPAPVVASKGVEPATPTSASKRKLPPQLAKPAAEVAPVVTEPAASTVATPVQRKLPPQFLKRTEPAAPAAEVPPATPSAVPASAAPVAPVETAPAQVALPTLPAAAINSFVWQPKANPVKTGTPGIMVQVVTDQILKMAAEGTFTDQDALQLLYHLAGRKS